MSIILSSQKVLLVRSSFRVFLFSLQFLFVALVPYGFCFDDPIIRFFLVFVIVFFTTSTGERETNQKEPAQAHRNQQQGQQRARVIPGQSHLVLFERAFPLRNNDVIKAVDGNHVVFGVVGDGFRFLLQSNSISGKQKKK